YEWNRRTQEGIVAGIRYFEEAIAEDPTYALAYTGLADCYALHVDYQSVPVAEGFARAIALDPHYATAHQWHAFLLTARGAFGEALVEGHTAVELDPGSVSARR